MAEASEFIELYQRDAQAVLVFLTRRVLDVEVALDLTAETFAQAWHGWPRVRSGSEAEVRGWLFTIARRQLSHYLRRGRVERRALRELGLTVPVLSEATASEVERLAELDTLRSQLDRQMSRLSEDQRRAIQLRIVDELSYPAVARELGTSESTARARVSRGLRTLALALEPAVAHQRSAP
jgi:RNA polymerase sigma factor (sigma-70 family)